MISRFIKTVPFTLTAYIDWNLDADRLVLCLPWYLDSGNYAHMQWHRAFFAQHGYLAVSFDPPGTFASPWVYTVTNYLQAIDELISYFWNKPTILLWHSLWGSLALLSSFSHPLVEKTISIMSPCDLQNRYQRYIWTSRQTTWMKTSIRDMPDPKLAPVSSTIPWSFVEDALKYTMHDQLATSTKPKLFVMGKEDSVIAPELVVESYHLAGNPKQLAVVDAYDHNYRNFPELIEQINNLFPDFIGFSL
jgi:pimeloyl-ACP methyl ester carboxylesterase